MLSTILEILFFALAITFIMAWGTIKKQRQSEEMGLKLVKTCEQKMMKAFQKQNLLGYSDLVESIQGTKASLFWSRKKAVIESPKIVVDAILADFINKGWIIEGKQKTYTWVKGEN